MAKTTRKKYKPKNIHEYKLIRKCHNSECHDAGIITYRKGIAHTEHSCIHHITHPKENNNDDLQNDLDCSTTVRPSVFANFLTTKLDLAKA
jgi:hypothetical protein